MPTCFKNLFFQLVNGACLVFLCFPLQAEPENLRVLILNSYDESAAPYFRPTELFRKKLQLYYEEPVIFQDMDLRQRGVNEQSRVDRPITELLLSRYGESPPHLVTAVGPPAIDFWVQNRESIFPNALFVPMARESNLRQTRLRPSDAPVATRFSFTGVVENILQLKPDTSHIVMVFGDSIAERTLSAGARKELASWSDRFSLEFTNDMATHEIQDRVASLPPEAAVFFGLFSNDINGVSLKHHSGLAMVRAASAVPVFGVFDDQLGHGIIGGSLIQVDRIGADLAEAAYELLRGTPGRHPMRMVELSQPTYDWRELEAWGLNLDRLPPGSTILFQPPGFWKQNGPWISWLMLIIVAQTILLTALLRQRRQRRKAELAHASLGRRLITAHEDERRLIARELHDDLSQRLARAAIDASIAQAGQGTEKANEAMKNLHSELVRVSRDVHDMSYRLHPSLVDDLGVVAALQSEIERVQRRTNVKVVGNIGDIQQNLSPETALCIYRIAQEALHNAVRHAEATTITMTFKQESDELKLSVLDDGIGFDFHATRDTFSLGLSSMQERALLVNGKLKFRSTVGKGTEITLIVPLPGATS